MRQGRAGSATSSRLRLTIASGTRARTSVIGGSAIRASCLPWVAMRFCMSTLPLRRPRSIFDHSAATSASHCSSTELRRFCASDFPYASLFLRCERGQRAAACPARLGPDYHAPRGLPSRVQGRTEELSEAAIPEAGYGAISHGQQSWVAVAILARGCSPVERGAGRLEARVNGGEVRR